MKSEDVQHIYYNKEGGKFNLSTTHLLLFALFRAYVSLFLTFEAYHGNYVLVVSLNEEFFLF